MHLETSAHCVDKTKKIEVGKKSQELTNGYYVTGIVLNALAHHRM